MYTRSSASAAFTSSVKPKPTKANKGKPSQAMAKTPTTPEVLCCLRNSWWMGTPSPSLVDFIQAAIVAAEVSSLHLPLFDKNLDILHASIIIALAQTPTNAQIITEFGNIVSSLNISPLICHKQQCLTNPGWLHFRTFQAMDLSIPYNPLLIELVHRIGPHGTRAVTNLIRLLPNFKIGQLRNKSCEPADAGINSW